MPDKNTLFSIGFRAYAVGVAVIAVFTVLLAFGQISVDPTLFGGMWLGLAGTGGVVAVGLTLNRESAIEQDRVEQRCQRWESCMFTGWLLNIYLIGAGIWSGVSFGWFLGGQSAAGISVVGYGWIAIAVYGAFVGAGTALYHRDYVQTALAPTQEADG